MCIAYLALGDPDWPLFIAANRDEFHQRPTLAAQPWADHPDVIAGIDVQGGGTWLGITRQGRFALLTNYREPGVQKEAAPSRGNLVGDYLTGKQSVTDYTDAVTQRSGLYNGFNLIVGDLNQASYISNRGTSPLLLPHGQHVVSNHLLNTPWPKTNRLRHAFQHLKITSLADSVQTALDALNDNTPAQDADLPDTGLDLERERLLSSPFIISPEYGTRCSTVIVIHKSGRGIFSETSFNPVGIAIQRHDWPLDAHVI